MFYGVNLLEFFLAYTVRLESIQLDLLMWQAEEMGSYTTGCNDVHTKPKYSKAGFTYGLV